MYPSQINPDLYRLYNGIGTLNFQWMCSLLSSNSSAVHCSFLPPPLLGLWGGRSQSKTDLASSPQPGWLLPCVYNIYLLLLQTFDTDGNSFESGTPTLDTAAFIFLMFWLQLQPFFNIHEV